MKKKLDIITNGQHIVNILSIYIMMITFLYSHNNKTTQYKETFDSAKQLKCFNLEKQFPVQLAMM